jgi:hypothetical protein
VDSQLFFYINLGLGVFFLLWFLAGRKNRGMSPTRLKLRNPTHHTPPAKDRPDPPSQVEPQFSTSDDTAVKNAKRLNILFLYNGHDWDAYQVLGVPAGASLSLVTERYQQLIREAQDKGQIEFYQAAYNAILKKV